MKKSFFYLFASAAIVAVTFTACDSNDSDPVNPVVVPPVVTINRTVDYTVIVAGSENSNLKSIEGGTEATVTVSIAGSVISKTTNASGQATFTGLTAGTAAVTVAKANYTSVKYLVDLTQKDSLNYDNETTRMAATKVILFPTTGTSLITVSGIVTAQLDVRNSFKQTGNNLYDYEQSSALEFAPQGTVITASLTPSNGVTELSNGEVIGVTYEGLTSSTTIGANGDYTISVPSSADGLPITIKANDFTYNCAYSAYLYDKSVTPYVYLVFTSGSYAGYYNLQEKTQRKVFQAVTVAVTAKSFQNEVVDIAYSGNGLPAISDVDYYGDNSLK